MGSLSNYAEQQVATHIFGSGSHTPAATVYLALCTSDPTDAGTGASMNECANANGYTRKAITFSAASGRQIAGSGTITFDIATGSWGTVSHWAIVDSGTYGAGNMIAHGALNVSRSIVNGNVASFTGSTITITVNTGGLANYACQKALDMLVRNTSWTKPATYMALTTATVSDTSTGSTITEPSGNNYARKLVNSAGGSSPAWSAPSNGATSNANQIDFATPSGSWGTIVAVAICDALTTGNLIAYDNGTTDQAVSASDPVNIQAAACTFSID